MCITYTKTNKYIFNDLIKYEIEKHGYCFHEYKYYIPYTYTCVTQ